MRGIAETWIALCCAGWLAGCSSGDDGATDSGTDAEAAAEDVLGDVGPDVAEDAAPVDDGGAEDLAVPDEASEAEAEAGDDGGVTDEASADEAPGEDVSVPDEACTPESDDELCAAAAAECGEVTHADRCGTTRTVDCGDCELPRSCGGAGGENLCGCTVPPDPAAVSCSVTTSGVRVRFTGSTTLYSYVYSSEGVPPSCSLGSVPADGRVGENSFLLAGGPWTGECGYYRLCASSDACTTSTSPGVVLYVCVDAVGGGTCSVI